MKLETCSHCGQIIPPANPFWDKPVKRRIYEIISKHPEGIGTEQVKDSVYADDINGGPESSSILSNHIRQMNVVLVPMGVRIWMRRGPGGGYRLIPVGGRHG